MRQIIFLLLFTWASTFMVGCPIVWPDVTDCGAFGATCATP